MDRTVGVVPDSIHGLIARTSSCIAVGTLPAMQGETLVSLSDGTQVSTRDRQFALDAALETPSKQLSVCSVLDEPLLVLDVPGVKTRVRIWVNDDTEPDEIRIVAYQAGP